MVVTRDLKALKCLISLLRGKRQCIYPATIADYKTLSKLFQDDNYVCSASCYYFPLL